VNPRRIQAVIASAGGSLDLGVVRRGLRRSLPAEAPCRLVVEFGGHIVEVAGAPIGIGRSMGEKPPRQQPIGIFDGRQMPCCAWATVVKPSSGRFGSMPAPAAAVRLFRRTHLVRAPLIRHVREQAFVQLTRSLR
jgi:hypothetical protein